MRLPIFGALVLFALTAPAISADAPKLCTQENLIHLHQENIGETDGRLVLEPPQQILEGTISVDLVLVNMTSTQPKHFVYRVDGLQHSFQKPVELVRFSQKNPEEPYRSSWKYHWTVGLPGGRHDDNYVYALPYQKNERHEVSQSYFGSFSHQQGTPNEYAVDFLMPEGTPVCAAREGIVVHSYGDSTVGGNDKKYEFCGNVVTIKHSDGTYARYVHLQPHGNLVRLGQVVHKGDKIGLSGKTGFADRPHLHFCVTVPIDGYIEKSVPVVFATAMGNMRQLRQGETY